MMVAQKKDRWIFQPHNIIGAFSFISGVALFMGFSKRAPGCGEVGFAGFDMTLSMPSWIIAPVILIVFGVLIMDSPAKDFVSRMKK